MLIIPRLKNIILRQSLEDELDPILPLAVQIKAWRKAARQMKWPISDGEFADLAAFPLSELTDDERRQGFAGVPADPVKGAGRAGQPAIPSGRGFLRSAFQETLAGNRQGPG